MITTFHSPDHTDWKTLYRAAILETNRTVLPTRISVAEAAVIERGREIFYAGGPSDEAEALEDALYALRAFKSAWDHIEGGEAA